MASFCVAICTFNTQPGILIYCNQIRFVSIALPKEAPQYKPDMTPLRRRKPLEYQLWQDERDSVPTFTFLLRPRVIQLHQTCKLLCCLSGRPTPTVITNFIYL